MEVRHTLMGLMGAEDHALAAYAASILASQPLSQTLLARQLNQEREPETVLPQQVLAGLSAALGEEAREEELVGVPQRHLGVKIDLQQQQNLHNMIGAEELREKARLGSLTLPHAGDGLNTAPLTALGLHLRQSEFVLVAKYRLGLKAGVRLPFPSKVG